MMGSLQELDRATSNVVEALVMAFAGQAWVQLRYAARWTPAGDVGADDFWLLRDTVEIQTLPEVPASLRVSDAAKHHWRLTQDLGLPRWYKMTLIVQRSGKFSVDFEYKEDYKEGDIMQRG